MLKVIRLRVISTIIVILGVATVLFFVMRLSGDPTFLLLAEDARPEEREQLRREMGLSDPLPIQYVRFLGGMVRGEFGESFLARKPALDMVMLKLPSTLLLAVVAQFFAIFVGIPVGIYAATSRGSPFAFLALLASLIGQAVPNFWLGVLMIMLFSVTLRWLPTSGMGTPLHLIMPVIALSTALMPSLVRLSRAGMLDTLGQDYIRTARAKGLTPNRVIYQHALKNMMFPVVTIIALEFANLVGCAVVVEVIFGWDGIGRQLIGAALRSDFPVAQATVFIVALMVIAANVGLDINYVWLDPRIRFS